MPLNRVTSMQEYKLICCDNSGDFQTFVNSELEDGWELYGNTFVRGADICQPLTRYKPLNTGGFVGASGYIPSPSAGNISVKIGNDDGKAVFCDKNDKDKIGNVIG